jgi:hypothetical protein
MWFSHCNAGKGVSRGSMVPMTLARGTYPFIPMCKRQNVNKSHKGDWDIYGVGGLMVFYATFQCKGVWGVSGILCHFPM